MLLRPIDLARALSCSARSVRRAASAGRLDHIHVGTDFRFRPEILELVLKKGLPSRGGRPEADDLPPLPAGAGRGPVEGLQGGTPGQVFPLSWAVRWPLGGS